MLSSADQERVDRLFTEFKQNILEVFVDAADLLLTDEEIRQRAQAAIDHQQALLNDLFSDIEEKLDQATQEAFENYRQNVQSQLVEILGRYLAAHQQKRQQQLEQEIEALCQRLIQQFAENCTSTDQEFLEQLEQQLFNQLKKTVSAQTNAKLANLTIINRPIGHRKPTDDTRKTVKAWQCLELQGAANILVPDPFSENPAFIAINHNLITHYLIDNDYAIKINIGTNYCRITDALVMVSGELLTADAYGDLRVWEKKFQGGRQERFNAENADSNIKLALLSDGKIVALYPELTNPLLILAYDQNSFIIESTRFSTGLKDVLCAVDDRLILGANRTITPAQSNLAILRFNDDKTELVSIVVCKEIYDEILEVHPYKGETVLIVTLGGYLWRYNLLTADKNSIFSPIFHVRTLSDHRIVGIDPSGAVKLITFDPGDEEGDWRVSTLGFHYDARALTVLEDDTIITASNSSIKVWQPQI